jgi:hypothetical protein
MILGTITRILKEDLAKGGAEVPAWVDSLIGPLNQFITGATQALRNNLTFRDNFDCKELTVKVTHGVEILVNPQSNRKVRGMLPLDASGEIIDKHGFSRKSDGQIGVTFYFDGGSSSTKVNVTFVLLF